MIKESKLYWITLSVIITLIFSCGSVLSGSLKYKVKTGDTLWDIARYHGVTTSSIRKANNLGKNSRIFVGETLIIPIDQNETEKKTEKDDILYRSKFCELWEYGLKQKGWSCSVQVKGEKSDTVVFQWSLLDKATAMDIFDENMQNVFDSIGFKYIICQRNNNTILEFKPKGRNAYSTITKSQPKSTSSNTKTYHTSAEEKRINFALSMESTLDDGTDVSAIGNNKTTLRIVYWAITREYANLLYSTLLVSDEFVKLKFKRVEFSDGQGFEISFII